MSRTRARLHFWWQRQLCHWRHDYEPIEVTADGVLLACFYCEHRRLSALPAAYHPHREDRP